MKPCKHCQNLNPILKYKATETKRNQGDIEMTTTIKNEVKKQVTKNEVEFAVEESKRYSIKGLKTMQGNDGLIIQCGLYYEKKKIAECFDDGNGGMLVIKFTHYNNKLEVMEEYLMGAEKRFDRMVELYPPQKVDISESWMEELYPTGFEKLDDESFVNKLITTELRSKDLKKLMKKNILILTKKNELLELSYKGKPTITQGHIDNYKNKGGAKKDDVVSILNELDFDKALGIYESYTK